MKQPRSRAWRALAASAVLLTLAHTAAAGLPLICHPLYTGDAALLPFGKDSGGRTIDRHYDVRKLPADLQRLLSGEAPLLARMENLRRAAHYAQHAPAIATRLLEDVVARAATGGPASRNAWFDAAYLLETFRQMGLTVEEDLLARVARPTTPYRDLNALDGYAMLGTLIAREGESAELEFARGLMMRNDSTQKHMRRAQALAPADPALAANLAMFASH